MRSLAWVLWMCLLWVDTAWAGPPELFRTVVPSRDPNALIVAYDWGGGGFYFSRDKGATFSLLCTWLIEPGLDMDDVFGLHQRPDGKLYIGMFGGMLVSDATQCSWSRVPMFEGRWVSGLVADPDDPNVVYATTSTGGGMNGLYRNDGKSDAWTLVGEEKPIFITRLHIVKTSGGKRFYQSSVVPALTATDEPQYFIRVSDDGGATWTEHEYPGADGALRLLAVDPTNPDRIVVAVQRADTGLQSETNDTRDDLLFSPSRGEPGSFQLIGKSTMIVAAAFTPDGALFYGDNDSATRGLYKVGKLGDAPATLQSDYKVNCLRYDAALERLYMCRDWLFGTLDPKSGEFTTLADMKTATSFHGCPDEQATAMKCESQFVDNYCSAGHYPESPLCQKFYPGSSTVGAGGGSGSGMVAAGSGGMGGVSAEAGAGQGGELAFGAEGAGRGEAGSGSGSTMRSESGCQVAGPGSQTGGGMGFLLMAAVAMCTGRRRRTAGLAIAALMLAAPGRAWAGPIEVFSSVEIAGSNPDRVVARWVFGEGGMYVSSDRGQSFHATCFGALGGGSVQGRNVQSFRTMPDGSICVGTYNALFCSDATMCSWSEAAELRGQWPADLTADPIDPNVLYLVTGTSEGTNGLYRREGPNGTWEKFGTHLNSWFSRVHVTKRGDGKRFYVSSLENVERDNEDGGMPVTDVNYYIRYSDDDGQTWTSHAYGPTPERSNFRLLAVDPTNPDNIVVGTLRTADNLTDTLLYSDRRGEPGSFKMIGEVTDFSGVTFTPDGTLYYGDNNMTTAGLYKVDKLGEPPTKIIGSYKVSCLAFDPASERLYVCADWLLGTADRSTGEFNMLFDMRTASSLLSCEGQETLAHTCSAAFLAPNFCDPTHYPRAPICTKYFGGAAGGTGAGTAGSGAAGTSAGGTAGAAGRTGSRAGGTAGAAGSGPGADDGGDDGCGCVAAGASTSGGSGMLLGIALVLGVSHRIGRRRRRASSQ